MPYDAHGGDIYDKPQVKLDFSVNINPLGMPEAVKRALVAALPSYAQYPDPQCRALRAALAARRNVAVEQVRCGNGASELIYALCACLRPGRVLVPAPGFSEYARAAALYGAAVEQHALLPEEGFALTRRLLGAIRPGLDLLFLCSPHNPTGRLIDAALLEAAAAACCRNHTWLLLDECFLDFTAGQSMLPQLARWPNLLVLRAFTKIYAMAGLRLGALYAADTRLLDRVAAHCPAWSVSAPAQAAGIAALQADGWTERTQQLVTAERAYLSRGLRRTGVTVYPSDANFLLLRGEKPLYAPLLGRGLLTRCCGNFVGLDDSYIRIGLKTRPENKALLSAVREIYYG